MDALRSMVALVRIRGLNELQYRGHLFAQLLQSALALIAGLVAVWLVYSNVDELNGWSQSELLVVFGTYLILVGVMGAIVEPSMQRLMNEIRDGSFDYTLLKPLDAQVAVSVWQFQPWHLVDVATGGVVLSIGAIGMESGLDVVAWLLYGLMLMLGLLAAYAIWLIMTTLSFWVIYLDVIRRVFEAGYQAGRWPITLYPGWMQVVFTVLVPIGFAVTVPAEALTSRLDAPTAVLATTFTLVMLGVARWFFGFGVRRYAGASS